MAGWFYGYPSYPYQAFLPAPNQTMQKTLPVHEIFHAFQGEGVHMGRSALFIRTFGCPVKCPWCDSAGTWHHKYVPANIARMSREDLEHEIARARDEIEFVVLTGGEPCIHADMLLVLQEVCEANNLPLHIETCGAFPIANNQLHPTTWVTVSPKWDKPPVLAMVRRADELKIIIEDPGSLGRWERHFKDELGIELSNASQDVWLHPEWSRREDAELLGSITNAVKRHGMRYRAGWQLHKLYQCDSLDGRSRPLVPLGGNMNLGF